MTYISETVLPHTQHFLFPNWESLPYPECPSLSLRPAEHVRLSTHIFTMLPALKIGRLENNSGMTRGTFFPSCLKILIFQRKAQSANSAPSSVSQTYVSKNNSFRNLLKAVNWKANSMQALIPSLENELANVYAHRCQSRNILLQLMK